MAEAGEEYLLRFLEIGVVNVNGDDDKLNRLRATAKDIAVVVVKDPANVALFTTAAADPGTLASDPSIAGGMAVVKKHWTTVSNTFSSTPVAVVRAVLVDALVAAARQSDSVAVAFVNTTRNVLPHVELGDEERVWIDAVREIEEQVDARAEQEWTTPEKIEVPKMAYQSPELVAHGAPEIEIDRKDLEGEILKSTSPWASGSRNSHNWQQNPQAWVQLFSTEMSKVIAACVEGAVQQVVTEPVDLGEPLKGLSTAVTSYVEKALACFEGATAGLQRRTNLLWWKEALYSQSVRASYRSLPVFEAASLMALDLFEQVPTFSPASVAAFLEEAILELPGVDECGKKPLSELLTLTHDSQNAAPLREVASELFAEPAGHGPVLAIVGHAGGSTLAGPHSVRDLAGIEGTTALGPAEWGSMLFRELQAARATTVTPQKRSRRRPA
ncbi:GTPase-associated system all-helical protein GASH [Paraburkholderia sp. BR14312]